jgi:Ca-activated chloride channel family protein
MAKPGSKSFARTRSEETVVAINVRLYDKTPPLSKNSIPRPHGFALFLPTLKTEIFKPETLKVFRYEHPEHLWLLAAVPLLALLLTIYWFWRKNAVARLGQTERVLQGFSPPKFWLKNVLLMLGIALLAIAWANPQLGAKKQTVTQQASDVFIALDISQSMLCRDVAPSRLDLARAFTQKLVQALEGERIGLIFFAGNAFLQMPLSADYSFIIQSIQSASPELITEQGTALPAAIELARQSFGYEPGGGRAVILITDGEDHDEGAVDKADKAYDEGIVIFPIGAGTAEGGPIPVDGLQDGSQYKRDEKGEIVRTRLNEQLLRQIALAGGGQALNMSQGDAAISTLRREIDNLQKRELEVRSFEEFESWYQWLLLPALLLLLLETLISFRKRT